MTSTEPRPGSREADAFLWLQNEHLKVALDPGSGALVAFSAVATGWEIVGRPALGLGWRLMVPLPGRRNNLINSGEQAAPQLVSPSDGGAITFVWPRVRSEHGGLHPIQITQEVRLSGRHAIFSLSIDNQSELTVENAYSPYIGDLQSPSPGEGLETFCSSYGGAERLPLLPTFANTAGYYGTDVPTQVGAPKNSTGYGVVPVSPFMLILAREQGLYFGVDAPDYEVVAWWAELHPGYEDSMDRRAPANERIAGRDVSLRFAAGHAAFILPGESRALTPIAVEPFRGDWHAGADVYRRWRDGWMAQARPPRWAAEPHSWLQLHLNSPEDELRVPFRDLPEIGRECAENGIRAIQLVGWNDGGQDQGNPSHRPDPRLGTVEELAAAIREIQAMGVRVVLFAKFIWADLGSDRYDSEFAALAVKDPRGDRHQFAGHRYQTLSQQLDISTIRLVPMCFNSEQYLRTCEIEFQRMVDMRPDGVLIDEACYHGPAFLCFDDAHGHRRPAPVFENDNELIRRLRLLSDPVNPDFLYAGEGLYDWEGQTYQCSYIRSDRPDHVPVFRYLLPDAPVMTALTGFDDRNMVNQCLLYRYVISYEPFNFKGRPTDFPATLGYGRRMDALRTALRGWFWDGRFRDSVGARASDQYGNPHHQISVFLHDTTGEPGVVVANYGREPIELELDVDGLASSRRYRLIDGETWLDGSVGVTLPPRSAALVVSSRSLDRDLPMASIVAFGSGASL